MEDKDEKKEPLLKELNKINNMKKLTFKKDSQGWYVDLKNTPFTRGQLAMVAGADTLLDLLSENRNEVTLEVSLNPFEGAIKLRRMDWNIGGSDYICEEYDNHELWLCPVTLYVLKKYPKTIYIKKV